MKQLFWISAVGVCLFLSSFEARAQEKPQTNKTSHESSEVERPAREKRYMTIYKKSTKGTLNGNKCMEEITHKMGFKYVVMPKDYYSPFGRVMHNFFIKTILFFKNPFWKIKVNKQMKRCRQMTGDFYG